MKVSEMEFLERKEQAHLTGIYEKWGEIFIPLKQALFTFPNGYTASVITGTYAFSDAEHPYEIAVMHDGHLDYSTPITSDVIGHLNEEEANEILAQIEALPPKEEKS